MKRTIEPGMKKPIWVAILDEDAGRLAATAKVRGVDWWEARVQAAEAFTFHGHRDEHGPIQPGSPRLMVARRLARV